MLIKADLNNVVRELKLINIKEFLSNLNRVGIRAELWVSGSAYVLFANCNGAKLRKVFSKITNTLLSKNYVITFNVTAHIYGYCALVRAQLNNGNDLVYILSSTGDFTNKIKFIADSLSVLCIRSTCDIRERVLWITKLLSLDDSVYKSCESEAKCEISRILRTIVCDINGLRADSMLNVFNKLYAQVTGEELNGDLLYGAEMSELYNGKRVDSGNNGRNRDFWYWCFDSAPEDVLHESYGILYDNLYDTYKSISRK